MTITDGFHLLVTPRNYELNEKKWEKLCIHCHKERDTHVGIQRSCLFASTTFQAMTEAEYWCATDLVLLCEIGITLR